ncbi:C-type lectin domain family 2 member D-like isoform X2 [Thamnophis elegans]|uniref:C-type lectin domain family 2 member D-like isoform X2 n=1 Tax=Thamnophis elegans TaxID=35005 RepID=UPI001376FF7C|nr:C-type lectin domain family 2 member D-like isoform X2 [Thamnophis elegans]
MEVDIKGAEGAEGDAECREPFTEAPTGPPSGCPDDIKNTGSGDSGRYHLLSSVVTPAFSSGSSDTKHERNVGQNGHLPGTHSRNKGIIALVILVVVLIIIIIAISLAETCPSCPLFASQGVACPDFWVGYKGKCFYISKEEGNWSLSLKTCLSLNASLAVIDTQEELDFWVKFFHPLHYWFGLSREVNQTWKWSNGTEFKNQFPVRGEGFCAYLNGERTDSSFCSMEKRFFCSQPESCRVTG